MKFYNTKNTKNWLLTQRRKHVKYYHVVVLSIIFVALCFVYSLTSICGFLVENMDNNEKYYAMTFGGGGQNYIDAVDRIGNELKATNEFDHVIKYTDKDLKNDTKFWNKHKTFITNNKRGCGYWIWKPYLMLKTLNKMNENDILFYMDAGCEVMSTNESKKKIKQLKDQCNNYDILYTPLPHLEKEWTKMDVFDYMKNDESIKNSTQKQATLIIVKKTEKIINFITNWYNISCNYHLIDDSPSKNINDVTFKEHRHDQSIFSSLLKINKYNAFNTSNNEITDYENAIKLSRRINE